MEGYRFVTEMKVRYRDLDAMGHVNNAVYATYLENARIEYYGEVLDLEMEELSFMLAHIELDYLRSITSADRVRIGVRVSRIGDKSMTTEFRVEASGETAAEGETVQVVVDDEGKPCSVPDEWRRSIREYEGEEKVDEAVGQ